MDLEDIAGLSRAKVNEIAGHVPWGGRRVQWKRSGDLHGSGYSTTA